MSKQKQKDPGISKLQRMLSSHSLQGLVYQKRQRKQTNNFTQSIPNHQHPTQNKINNNKPKTLKNTQKVTNTTNPKINHHNNKALNTSLENQKTINKPSTKIQKQIKKRGRPKKTQQDQDQSINSNDNNINKQSQLNNEEFNKSQNQKNNENEQKPQINNKKIETQKSSKQLLNFQPENHSNQPSNSNQSNSLSNNQQQNQPQKISSRNIQNSENNSQSEPNSNKKQLLQVDHQNSPKIAAKGHRILRARKIVQNQEEKQQDEEDEQGSATNGRKRRLRFRKTKGQALKKFTMLEAYSDNEDPEYYEGRKRRGTNDKDYQINRIFRKTQKFNYPSALIDCNITKISFPLLVEKFGTFDVVHCSLPLDMLVKLPEISCLIPRGFLFIWAQFGEIQLGYHWLNRHGFDVIDQVMWIRTNEDVTQCQLDVNSNDQIFPNCRSTCLVGYKCSSSQKTQYCTKISNNIIFSPDRLGSIEKPDEIYQIQDLMMPGAKKLEIGLKEVGGWLALRHHEDGILRCWKCLRKNQRDLFLQVQNMSVKCEYCLKQAANKSQNENEIKQKQNSKQQYSTINNANKFKLQIINLSLFDSLNLICQICKLKHTQLLQPITYNEGEKFPLSCKNCLTIPENTQVIKVHNLKEVYFPTKSKKCSSCQKSSFKKHYFECFSCKTQHILCTQCFSKIPLSESSSSRNHDWKLIPLYQSPQMKAQCFSCGDECMLPYWGCETCQNWYWCGKCESSKGNNGRHCHYQSNHHLHLIM